MEIDFIIFSKRGEEDLPHQKILILTKVMGPERSTLILLNNHFVSSLPGFCSQFLFYNFETWQAFKLDSI